MTGCRCLSLALQLNSSVDTLFLSSPTDLPNAQRPVGSNKCNNSRGWSEGSSVQPTKDSFLSSCRGFVGQLLLGPQATGKENDLSDQMLSRRHCPRDNVASRLPPALDAVATPGLFLARFSSSQLGRNQHFCSGSLGYSHEAFGAQKLVPHSESLPGIQLWMEPLANPFCFTL